MGCSCLDCEVLESSRWACIPCGASSGASLSCLVLRESHPGPLSEVKGLL